jgi:hypothetical protein
MAKKVDGEAADIQRKKIITFKKVFSTPEGKEVLFELMNRNFILTSHKGDSYSEGRRSAILDVLHLCNVDVAVFDEMLKGENE